MTRYLCPPPYSIARLTKAHAKAMAKGCKFGVFKRTDMAEPAELLAPFKFEVEAFRYVWSLADRKKQEPEAIEIDEATEQRLKQARIDAGARCG